MLEDRFAIKHEGPLNDYLGCQYNITKEGTTINNSKFIKALGFEHFGGKTIIPTYSPIDTNQDATPAPQHLGGNP